MARVLGLDLGSHTVRGVLLETSVRGAPQVRARHAVRRAQEGDKLETLKAAVAELLSNRELHSEAVAVAVPWALATHPLTLPFTDPKRLDATVGFEIEAQLPFDLAEAAFDYQATPTKDKKSDLLVAVVRKDELKALLGALGAAGVDPRVVTHPALAHQSFLLQGNLDPVPEGEAIAIVDIGHERTSMTIGRPFAQAEFARTFPGGGKDLTRALAAEFQTSPADAEAWKDQHAAVGAAAEGPEGERASGAFVRGLQPVIRELRSTLRSYSARSRRQVSRIYLAGGTARMRGLDAQLSQDLGIPCAPLPLPAGQGPEEAQALALAMRAAQSGARGPRFNLRRGELSFKGDFDYLRDRLGLIASYAATLLILLVASLLVRGAMLSRQERAVDAQLCEITKRVLGSCEKDYTRALSMLRGKESPAEVIPKYSAVTLLGQLTEKVPEDVNVTFDQINIDLERVTLRGQTDTTQQVDALTSALKANRCFKEVQQGRLEKTGSKVAFRLDIQVQCPEEASAPQG